MVIGNIDKKVTNRNIRKEIRIQKTDERKKKELQRIEESKSVIVHEEEENSVEDDNESETDHLVEFRDKKERGKKRKRLTKSEMSDLRSTLEISDRFNLSNTATAHIYNAVSTKSGIITKEDSSEVMYQTKVGRLRKKLRIQKVQEMKEMKLVAIGFDERKDMT